LFFLQTNTFIEETILQFGGLQRHFFRSCKFICPDKQLWQFGEDLKGDGCGVQGENNKEGDGLDPDLNALKLKEVGPIM
jgi:hypothetical protein